MTISSMDSQQTFGVVAVSGDGRTESSISHLRLSRGSQASIRGAVYTGGLAIHCNGRVVLVDCTIERCDGDDGLNVKYGEVLLERCTFRDNRSDQVDLDVCTGIIRGCSFQGRDENPGDGLDVVGGEANENVQGVTDASAYENGVGASGTRAPPFPSLLAPLGETHG